MEIAFKATPGLVRDYFRLFVNRRAYTLQSMRPQPESGRHYYYQPKAKGTEKPLSLTNDTIRRHLEEELTLALYAINPATQRCKWLAIDADYEGAMEDLVKLQYYLSEDKVQAALEMSKRGGHLWVFLRAPLLARECRIYIYNLALRLGLPVKGAGLAEGIEVFPKHDQLGLGEFGNAIRGPLGIHGAQARRGFGRRLQRPLGCAILTQQPSGVFPRRTIRTVRPNARRETVWCSSNDDGRAADSRRAKSGAARLCRFSTNPAS